MSHGCRSLLSAMLGSECMSAALLRCTGVEELVSADLLPQDRYYFPLDTIPSLERKYPRAVGRLHEFHELKAYTPWVPRTITWIDGLEYFYVPYVDLRRALAQAMLPPIEAEDVSGL